MHQNQHHKFRVFYIAEACKKLKEINLLLFVKLEYAKIFSKNNTKSYLRCKIRTVCWNSHQSLPFSATLKNDPSGFPEMYIGTFKTSCSSKWPFWYTKQQHFDLVCYQGSCQPRYNDTRTNLSGKFPHSLSLHTGLRSSTPSVNAPDITLNCCMHMYTSTCLRWLKARKWLIEMLHLRLVCCRFLSLGKTADKKNIKGGELEDGQCSSAATMVLKHGEEK